MATRKRKSRKMRGSRTCGWGRSGQHRKGGMRGGRGKAGTFKHKWPSVLRYGWELRKKGFTSPKTLKDEGKVINVGELERLIEESGSKGDVVNLTELGYVKLLGGGRISRPLNIEVNEASEAAKRKIMEAGGTLKVREAK
ncbi:MAG: uL15m family ribosomal protein [Candidatus Bathyarchaeia archaeon]